MKTRLAAALAGLAGLVAAGLVVVAAPAQATNHIHATVTQPDPVCEATWEMRGATGAYPTVVFGGPPDGSSVTKTTAKLVKPNTGVQPGVEFAAFDLDVQAPADNELLVGVDYTTADGATTVAGAVRLFGYKVNDADTLEDAPTYGPDVAGSESGHLVLTIPAGEKLGTLGMVFDASNSSQGSVTFSNPTIGNRPVWFTGCPEPEPTVTPTATPEPTQTATPGPVQDCQAYVYTGTQENLCADFPGDQENVTCADVKYRVTLVNKNKDPWGLDGSGENIGTVGVGCESNPLKPTQSTAPVPTLPVTGSTPLWFALAGLAALGSGALLFVLARRRRSVSFRA